jgi:hypothetical protein
MFSLVGALSTILFMPPFEVAIAIVSGLVPLFAASLFGLIVTSATLGMGDPIRRHQYRGRCVVLSYFKPFTAALLQGSESSSVPPDRRFEAREESLKPYSGRSYSAQIVTSNPRIRTSL